MLDTVTASWIPDTYFLYGQEGLDKFSIDDTRYLKMDDRLMITNNQIHPQCWRLSKIDEKEPEGLLRLTFKRDTYDETRDNPELMLCDYYSKTRDIKVNPVELDKEFPDISIPFDIKWGIVDDEFLVADEDQSEESHSLHCGETSFFICDVDMHDGEVYKFNWSLQLIDEENEISQEDNDYYIGLLDINNIDDSSISIKPAKANSLIGKRFVLTAQDKNNIYKSELELEVK